MKINVISILISLLFLLSCLPNKDKASIEKYKLEIINTEREFAKLLAAEGIAEAFYQYADSNAVINRRNGLVKGKEAIKEYYNNYPYTELKLEWEPDFVDVAASDDFGYTYGKSFFSAKDTTGKIVEYNGYFHTVWKRQKDGTWRYVWD